MLQANSRCSLLAAGPRLRRVSYKFPLRQAGVPISLLLLIMTHYLSLDVETRGVLFNNPVTAIGVYVAPIDPVAAAAEGALVIKKRWALAPLPGQEDEARCVTEFCTLYCHINQ